MRPWSRSVTCNRSCSADGQPDSRRTVCPSRASVVHARTPGSPSTLTRQFGQSPLRHDSPRRRWCFSDRVNVRTPARYSALATVSPASTGTRRPSNSSASLTEHDPVLGRVAGDGHPAPASERVEPALPLRARCVLAEVHPHEVLLRVWGRERSQLAAERELLERPRPAPRARHLEAHRPARLRPRRIGCAEVYPGAPVTPPPGCTPAPQR